MPTMRGKQAETQEESRSERIAIAVTEREKRAVRAVAALRGVEDSNLVRAMPIADIVTEFERLREQAEEVA